MQDWYSFYVHMNARLYGNKFSIWRLKKRRTTRSSGRMRKTLRRSSMQARPRVSSSIVRVRQAYLVHGPTLPLESRFPRRHAHRQTNDVLFVRSRAFFPPPPLLPTCNDKDDVISSMISNSIGCSYREGNDMEEITSLPWPVHSSSRLL